MTFQAAQVKMARLRLRLMLMEELAEDHLEAGEEDRHEACIAAGACADHCLAFSAPKICSLPKLIIFSLNCRCQR